ncbi:hypothetical protein BJ944DRAFT_270735 [Cunninghamella echinulata]|nr:hypothetical protein BJ944DRAFT_270735 [Cunninghamella echinulata]
MYAGHLAPILPLFKMYPNVSPFVFSFGVGFLDYVFGFLSIYGYEGLSLNPEAGRMGVDINVTYSHSIVGTILLSSIYGMMTGTFLPGFLASASHFVGDWLVHNDDLYLDPFTKAVVGGIGLWGSYPIFSYYFELICCLVCFYFSERDVPTLAAMCYILYIHFTMRPNATTLAGELLKVPEQERGIQTCKAMVIYFTIPAVIIGSILTYGNSLKRKNKQF